jgi:hypothetical protein
LAWTSAFEGNLLWLSQIIVVDDGDKSDWTPSDLDRVAANNDRSVTTPSPGP